MKYLYIEHTKQGYRISIDVPNTASREGLHYIGYTRKQAIKAFRQGFNCIGKHFTIIEY